MLDVLINMQKKNRRRNMSNVNHEINILKALIMAMVLEFYNGNLINTLPHLLASFSFSFLRKLVSIF